MNSDSEMDSKGYLTQDAVDKWTAQIRPLPLPDYLAPLDGCPLENLTDDGIMKVPPHMIAHVQRTAAQGGMQVISPRQTPITALMTRSASSKRQLGDHIVGSTAVPGEEWPTIDDFDFSELLPDEPLASKPPEKAVRGKTKAEPLTKATTEMSDPVLACLVKGRAVIDILRRPDVAGGGDEMTSILAQAWGVGTDNIDDLDAFTIGVDGPLLRHAIKTDEVYPMCYAPIHVRQCVSVGASEVTRNLLPDDTAMDWRRMRVHCEAVFTLACSIEGIPIDAITASPAPGDPSASPIRHGVLCFLPAPATAWTFEASTFSISPMPGDAPMKVATIPRDVLQAMTRYTELVRPVSYLMTLGHTPSARRSLSLNVTPPLGETITAGYKLLVQHISVGSARGRTAAATVRNMIYEAIQSAPNSVRLRLARYITIAQGECFTHLGTHDVPDRVIYKIADRFLEIGSTIRLKVVSEATKRGATVEQWWNDILAQAPDRYVAFTEGTRGWAIVGMWLMFKAPTDRWEGLKKAVKYSAIRDAERRAVGGIALPAKKGSEARLLAACRAVVKNIARAYAGYYMGVYDVAMVIADVAEEMNRPRSAAVLREGAYMWNLRARCLRGTNVNPISPDYPTPSVNHHRVPAKPIHLLIAPSPYRAFETYKKHIEKSDVIHKSAKAHILNYTDKVISPCFTSMPVEMCPAPGSTVTKYLISPHELGADLERAWRMLREDVMHVAAKYGENADSRSPSPTRKKAKVIAVNVYDIAPPPDLTAGMSYWDLLADMDPDEAEGMDDRLIKAGPEIEERVTTGIYQDLDHLRRVVREACGAAVPSVMPESESVL